jgi:hypothetical protein
LASSQRKTALQKNTKRYGGAVLCYPKEDKAALTSGVRLAETWFSRYSRQKIPDLLLNLTWPGMTF